MLNQCTLPLNFFCFIGTIYLLNIDCELLESRAVSMSAVYSVFSSAILDTKLVHNSCLLNEYKLDLHQKFLVMSALL